MLAVLVFVFVIPTVIPLLADWSMSLMDKIRKGEFLGLVFRPFKAVCAVISIFGLLAVEYRVLHGPEGGNVFNVYCELVRSLVG